MHDPRPKRKGDAPIATHLICHRILATMLAALIVLTIPGCYSQRSTVPSTGTATSPKAQPEEPRPSDNDKTDDKPWEDFAPEAEVDPMWPTTNKELLAIPESQRWYYASEHVGTQCTIVGPVVDVYQAKESNGMPIFVSIGRAYPDSHCVTLLIWAEHLDGYEEMLHDVDHGNAWISVTGYLSLYNGNMQFNSDDPIQYRWWTGVK